VCIDDDTAINIVDQCAEKPAAGLPMFLLPD